MSELLAVARDKKAALKNLIGMLHAGADPEGVKGQFADVIRDATAEDIARIEGELIGEGMPRQEIERLCEVHIAVFEDALRREDAADPLDHPVEILKKEHELLLELGSDLKTQTAALRDSKDAVQAVPAMRRIEKIMAEIKASGSHYVREENVIFSYLEKHGVVQPPAIMWSEHDQIRAIEKTLENVLASVDPSKRQDFAGELVNQSEALAGMFESHFYKENNILFPTALRLFTDGEWKDSARQFGEIGYWKVVPSTLPEAAANAEPSKVEGEVSFETGSLPVAVLEQILDTMPVDFTFVDAEDRVRYFSNGRDRVFPRTKAIIGRAVQQCHPAKSVDKVNQILSDFKAGSRDSADFWIQSGESFVVIRYFAIRSKAGEYLGCLEVTQDAAWLRSLVGEKRLLQG